MTRRLVAAALTLTFFTFTLASCDDGEVQAPGPRGGTPTPTVSAAER